jgi:hypothetical protein
MRSAAKLWRPSAAQARHVALSDPAERVVTDFARESPVVVTEDRAIEDTLGDMIAAGVRALLVVRGNLVSGLITSHSIGADDPRQLLQIPSCREREIEVGHVMTPWERVPKLDWSWIEAARMYDVAKVLRSTGATHIVVVERVEPNGTFVRALISRTRLNRQLGYSIE